MNHLADIALISRTRRRFVAYAEPCCICGQLTNEWLAAVIAGSEISVFACTQHPDIEVVDELVWTLATYLRKPNR